MTALSKTSTLGILAALSWFATWPGAAMADPPTGSPPPYFLTILLDSRTDQAPDHVCLVSAGSHPDWPVVQADGAIGPPDASLPLEKIAEIPASKAPEISGSDPVGPMLWKFDVGSRTKIVDPKGPLQSRPHIAAALGALVCKAPVGPMLWKFDVGSRTRIVDPKGPLRFRPQIAAALGALVFDDAATPTCADPGSVCRPSFEIPPYIESGMRDKAPLHIACTPNARSLGHSGKRTLMVFLNTHTGAHPPIRRIVLDGNVITVRFKGSVEDSAVFIASVLGGHYSPGETATSFNRRIILTPAPRCHETSIELPDYHARSEQMLRVGLQENARPLLSCSVQAANGYAKVSLPERSTADPKTLELQGQTSGLRFTATWSDRSPPATLRGMLRGISLYWTRHCLYSEGEACPSARLLDSGLDCDEGVPDLKGCSYRCNGGDSNIPIHLPDTVRFTRKSTHETWTARVSYSGARVDAYVDARDRKIFVRTPPPDTDGFLADYPGVSEIELLFPKERSMTLPFNFGMNELINAPDIECDQKVVYHYVGAYPYAESKQPLKSGAVTFGDPGELSSILDPRVFMGIGYESLEKREPDFSRVIGKAGMVGTLGGWNSWWFVDALFEATFGQREYQVQTADGGRSTHSAAITRGLFGIAPGIRMISMFTSVGIEGGFSEGFTDTFPGRGVFAIVLRVRTRVSHSSSLSITFHGYLGEQTRILAPDNQLVGTQYRSGSSVELAWEFSFGTALLDLKARYARSRLDAHRAKEK